MVDIKKKNRIIQAYYMKMEPGDLISEETELHKVGVAAIWEYFKNILKISLS